MRNRPGPPTEGPPGVEIVPINEVRTLKKPPKGLMPGPMQAKTVPGDTETKEEEEDGTPLCQCHERGRQADRQGQEAPKETHHRRCGESSKHHDDAREAGKAHKDTHARQEACCPGAQDAQAQGEGG